MVHHTAGGAAALPHSRPGLGKTAGDRLAAGVWCGALGPGHRGYSLGTTVSSAVSPSVDIYIDLSSFVCVDI